MSVPSLFLIGGVGLVTECFGTVYFCKRFVRHGVRANGFCK